MFVLINNDGLIIFDKLSKKSKKFEIRFKLIAITPSENKIIGSI